MASPALTCRELVELVTEYLEEKLPPAERLRFETHLAACQGCRNYLAQMRLTLRALGQLTEAAIPVEGRDELLQTFRDWKRR